ncbi:MAG: S41 family peptidase [Bacteroidota bacterium]
MKKNRFLLPIIFSVILIIGILIGNWYGTNVQKTGQAVNAFLNLKSNQLKDGDINFSLLPRNNKLSSILSYIENEYVDTVDINKLSEAAIPEIISHLDPHSVYIPARDLQKYNEPLQGNFSGIGIQFNMIEDTVAVVNTIPNGPSEIVGLMAGDRIVEVDDSIIAGKNMSTDQIIRLLKGEKGSIVEVGVIRRGEDQMLEFEIVRDDIPLYSVDVSYMLEEDIGYMKISNFSQTTYLEFIEGVEKLHNEGMKKFIVDLRGNGGGIMDAATNIADQFLEENKLIVYTQGKNRPRYDVYSSNKGVCKEDEVIVLIDEFSASASEILAGAIQDNDRGIIVGRRSFGKGLVQEQIEFRDGSALRLTIARYYTPTGRSIQKAYAPGDENYYEDIHERFEHGEFESIDSIQFADSLKYETPGGNIVYGGGGIMPDVFIPLDTSGISTYFSKIRSMGLIYRFAFDYTDQLRPKMQDLTTAEEISLYLDKNTNYFERFLNYAEGKGIERVPEDIKESEEIIRTQIKAYIARNLIDNEGYFPMIRQIDNTLQKAVSIMESRE